MLCISTKFCEVISNGIKVILILKVTKVKNPKNVGGVTVVNLCMSSGHGLYLCQVS